MLNIVEKVVKFIAFVAVVYFVSVNVIGPAWDAEAEYSHNKVSEYTQRLQERDFNRSINK